MIRELRDFLIFKSAILYELGRVVFSTPMYILGIALLVQHLHIMSPLALCFVFNSITTLLNVEDTVNRQFNGRREFILKLDKGCFFLM